MSKRDRFEARLHEQCEEFKRRYEIQGPEFKCREMIEKNIQTHLEILGIKQTTTAYLKEKYGTDYRTYVRQLYEYQVL